MAQPLISSQTTKSAKAGEAAWAAQTSILKGLILNVHSTNKEHSHAYGFWDVASY